MLCESIPSEGRIQTTQNSKKKGFDNKKNTDLGEVIFVAILSK